MSFLDQNLFGNLDVLIYTPRYCQHSGYKNQFIVLSKSTFMSNTNNRLFVFIFYIL